MGLHHLEPSLLCDLAWALARLHYQPSEEWVVIFTGRCRAVDTLFTMQQQAVLIWAFRQLRLAVPDNMLAWEKNEQVLTLLAKDSDVSISPLANENRGCDEVTKTTRVNVSGAKRAFNTNQISEVGGSIPNTQKITVPVIADLQSKLAQMLLL